MKTKHRTEITYETHERTVIRYSRGQATGYCRRCAAYTTNISIAQASSILSSTEMDITRSVQAGEIHAIERAGDPMMLCGNSLRMLLAGEK